jgi:hypothetical protein
VEDHERHHVPAGRARHGLAGGDDPFNGLGEGRQLARLNETNDCSRETLERVQFDIAMTRFWAS